MTILFVVLIGCFLIYCIGDVIDKLSKGQKEAQMNKGSKVVELSADEIIENVKYETARIEAFIQAGLVGDQNTIGAINTGTYNGPLPEKRDDGGWLSIYDNLRILKIAGINHRQGISRYTGRVECALVPEPTNEFDHDAIKVVAEDSHHLGYIPSNQTDFVRSLTANEFPYRCTAFIRESEDEVDGHQFFVGFVYIKRLD